EPKCARLDRFFIVESELIRIDRDTRYAYELIQQSKDLCVYPSRLSVAKRIKGVEADFHPLACSYAFNVVDRNTILERKTGMISAKRQAALGGQSPEKDLHTPYYVSANDGRRISVCYAIQFTIAHRRSCTQHVLHRKTLDGGELFDFNRRRGEFNIERNLVSLNKRASMIKHLRGPQQVAGSGCPRFSKIPSNPEVQAIEDFSLLAI